jgi:hypothetical protein
VGKKERQNCGKLLKISQNRRIKKKKQNSRKEIKDKMQLAMHLSNINHQSNQRCTLRQETKPASLMLDS